MIDFESKLKEIVEIDDSWEVKSFYGKTTYYTFLNNTYCVSECEHKDEHIISYVLSKKDKMLYMGYDDKRVLKLIEKEANKSKNKC